MGWVEGRALGDGFSQDFCTCPCAVLQDRGRGFMGPAAPRALNRVLKTEQLIHPCLKTRAKRTCLRPGDLWKFEARHRECLAASEDSMRPSGVFRH